MDGKQLSSESIVKVQKYIRPVDSKNSGASQLFNNIFVKQFPTPDFTDSHLQDLFSNFGEIVSSVIMKNQAGESLGFGFVCFKEATSATRAVEAMNGKDGLYVRQAKKRAER